MAEENRAIFLADETTGAIADTITIASGSTTMYSREILESSDSTTERVLFVNCADDDDSTPTIQVKISLWFGGSAWSEYIEIESASVTPKEIKVSSYGKSWWVKNIGVKFQITKSGAGAVTFTNARWI